MWALVWSLPGLVTDSRQSCFWDLIDVTPADEDDYLKVVDVIANVDVGVEESVGE